MADIYLSIPEMCSEIIASLPKLESNNLTHDKIARSRACGQWLLVTDSYSKSLILSAVDPSRTISLLFDGKYRSAIIVLFVDVEQQLSLTGKD
jgi:hypothetical protein